MRTSVSPSLSPPVNTFPSNHLENAGSDCLLPPWSTSPWFVDSTEPVFSARLVVVQRTESTAQSRANHRSYAVALVSLTARDSHKAQSLDTRSVADRGSRTISALPRRRSIHLNKPPSSDTAHHPSIEAVHSCC